MTDKQRILIGRFIAHHSEYTDIMSVTNDLKQNRTGLHSDDDYLTLVRAIEGITTDEKHYRQEQQMLHGNVSLTTIL